ncbi:conserved membrane protein of unknown function [Nitrospira sp. KM1]|uniref:hypothetical protein n=1 Tax=Nitrospira sp. KM1 TaxID=1936990 RepID=UPI0013A736B8|nr:hypothetical protein [Nitrospira sp. KM1]BCA54395.1 conserved membrane protein of unknown function [Nitrospira sp. KM1]
MKRPAIEGASDRSLRATPLLLLLGVIVLNFVLQPLTEPDFGWHLRTGLDLMSRGFLPPPVDPYSHTMPDWPWVEHAWLSDILIGIVYDHSGGLGVIILFGAVTAGAWMLAADLTASLPAGRYMACVLSLWTALPYLGARTQLISLLGLALLLRMLSTWSEASTYWGIPCLFLLWSNLHGGFLAGIFLLGLYAGASSFMRWIVTRNSKLAVRLDEAVPSKASLIRLSIVLGISILVTFINPYGWRLYEEILSSLSDQFMLATLQEWQPPAIDSVAGRSFVWYLGGLTAGMLLWYRRVEPVRWFLLGIFLMLSWRHMRNIPLFLLLSLSLCAELVTAGLQQLRSFVIADRQRDRWSIAAVTMVTGLFILWLGPDHLRHVVESGRYPKQFFHRTSYPIEAVDWIQSHRANLGQRLYNDYQYGGFLLWWLPNEKIFIDGRMPAWHVGKRRIFEDYMALTAGTTAGLAVLDKYAVDWAVVRRDTLLDAALAREPEWKKMYEDEKVSIYSLLSEVRMPVTY